MNQTAPIESPEVTVTHYEQIPPLDPKQYPNIGDLRIFFNNAILKKFLPENNYVSFAWASLQSHEKLHIHSHELATMIIIYKGSATLVGQKNQRVQAGDKILIPANCEYGFEEIGKEGLYAITIEFRNSSAVDVDTQNKWSFEALIAHNEQRMQQILKNPFYSMLAQPHTLQDPQQQQTFLNAVQVVADFFQMIMFGRQATCLDPNYQKLFIEHFREELDHNKLLAERSNKKEIKDPILTALASWFASRMFVYDNIEKTALVHLVLELSGHYYHTLAREKVGKLVNSRYYDIHSEDEEEHTAMGMKLLKSQKPETYRRLYQIIDEAWDIFDAMTSRIAYLVKNNPELL